MSLKSSILVAPVDPKRRSIGDVIFLDPERDAQGIVLGRFIKEAGVDDIHPTSSFGSRIDRAISRFAGMTTSIGGDLGVADDIAGVPL